MESKKKWYKWTYLKQEEIHGLRQWTYGCWVDRMEGWNRQGVWDGHVHTDIFKMDNQQGHTG